MLCMFARHPDNLQTRTDFQAAAVSPWFRRLPAHWRLAQPTWTLSLHSVDVTHELCWQLVALENLKTLRDLPQGWRAVASSYASCARCVFLAHRTWHSTSRRRGTCAVPPPPPAALPQPPRPRPPPPAGGIPAAPQRETSCRHPRRARAAAGRQACPLATTASR